MATLEKRSGQYRVIFYVDGQRFTRSLKTKHEREARPSIARLDDNLRRVELGLLAPSGRVDLASFLLSDGRVEKKLEIPTLRTMPASSNYFKAIPTGSIERAPARG